MTRHAYNPNCECRPCIRIRDACGRMLEQRRPYNPDMHPPGILPPGYQGIPEEAK